MSRRVATQRRSGGLVRITFDYAVVSARTMWHANPSLRCCFVSGRSADQSERSTSLFARIKGRTERTLADRNDNAYAFRPGYIRATARSVRRRDAGRYFAPIAWSVDRFTDNFSIDRDQLAYCLLCVARGGTEQRLLDNSTIKSWKRPR